MKRCSCGIATTGYPEAQRLAPTMICNATLQAMLAVHAGSSQQPNYGVALATVCGIVAVALAVMVTLGPERRDVAFEV